MRRLTVAPFLLAVGFSMVIGRGTPGFDGPDRAEIRATLADQSIPAEERARRALEAATSIDQDAQGSRSDATRRKLWVEARGLLDDFLEENPTVGTASLIRFQASVYRWAEGKSLVDQAELTPADAEIRTQAIQALDDAIERLRVLGGKTGDANDPLAQNIRFRLAQAIADRASLEPAGNPTRQASEQEAQTLLDPSVTAPGLRSFARLLRADLANRLGHYGQAQMELEEAEKLMPPPPAGELLRIRVAALVGREIFAEARSLVDASDVDPEVKRLLTLRIVLGRRWGLPPGPERKEIDAEAFRIAGPMAGSGRIEARRGLMELARTVDEPAKDAPPEWWELLAEGQLRLGNPARAGRLAAKGADHADEIGRADNASALRYKAGACLFEAEKFAESDRALTRVFETTKAPKELRAKAGMLRALARGRALATREPGASRASYQEGLECQVRDFPDAPPTSEARWLLAKLRLASGRQADAVGLLSAIKHGQTRWLEARLLASDLAREAVEDQRINRDESEIKKRMEEARRITRTSLDEAAEGPEASALLLKLARLELTPRDGDPSEAIEICERALRTAAGADQHRLARIYRVVAMAQAGRSAEAEKAAQAEAKSGPPGDLLSALQILDRSASEADSDIRRRRLGLILRGLTSGILDQLDEVSPADRDRIRLSHIRALLFCGNPGSARKELTAWEGPKNSDDQDLFRDLADLYLRLDAPALAIDAERIRATRLAPGSLPWFEARYGLALAYYRADRAKDARKVIDATAILHPELGGADLRSRFERLRQKLGNED
ncbi:hypothetical protein P12x_001919 [Tundrisphaera lichenicola]|uniref:hypothetical protein n=1 Tax=Tundrisphaera lichenicola TaxID=2029860 RepID=UPI003EBF4766